MKTFTIYYMKPEFFRDGSMGYDWLAERGRVPKPDALDATHIELKTVEFKSTGNIHHDLERVWIEMQGENWSPNGEARPLIAAKGLQHTSMSMGDIVAIDGGVWIADRFGFRQIEEVGAQ